MEFFSGRAVNFWLILTRMDHTSNLNIVFRAKSKCLSTLEVLYILSLFENINTPIS